MLSIYSYNNASAFLKDAWQEKKKRNPAFSLRAWATKIGFENNAPLSLMLSGKRPVPKKYLPVFIDDLNLSPHEGVYLETLVDFTNAKNPKQKEYYFKRLESLSPSPTLKMLEVETFKFLGDPIHTQILEMSVLQDFSPSSDWIKSRLITTKTLSEINDCIQRLKNLGLIKVKKNGDWTKSQTHLSNQADVVDLGSQEYHQKVSKLASDAVSSQTIQEREFQGYSMNIKKTSIPRAKELMREFTQKFIQEIEAAEFQGEETYQFNLQFFSLTQPNKIRSPRRN